MDHIRVGYILEGWGFEWSADRMQILMFGGNDSVAEVPSTECRSVV